MKYEIQKLTRITDVIISLFMNHSAKKVNISIEDMDDRYIIIVESDNIDLSEEKILKFEKLLSVQRQKEIEEYYWQLASNDADGDEINLIGMMIDEAIFENKFPSLKATFIRYK